MKLITGIARFTLGELLGTITELLAMNGRGFGYFRFMDGSPSMARFIIHRQKLIEMPHNLLLILLLKIEMQPSKNCSN
jgi:hypothetical protein